MTTDEPPRKRLRFDVDDGPQLDFQTILVRVGAKKKEYHLHENLLRANSGFFDAALKKEWMEGQHRTIDMSETKVEPFDIWAKWIYTGRIFLKQNGDVEMVNGIITKNAEWTRWSNCYALGDFLQDTDFKDACVDACIEAMCDQGGSPHFLPEWLYSSSRKASSHRKLAVDVFVHCRTRASWLTDMEHPAEFLFDVIKAMSPHVSSGINTKPTKDYFDLKETCKYHDHGSEKPCYKTKHVFRF